MKTKTKITVAVVNVLSVVALAGTGYAGWVISKNADGEKEGSIQVYDVTDKTVTLDNIALTNKKDKIIWGKATENAKTEVNGKTIWFNDTSDNMDVEFFTPDVTFDVKNNSTSDTTKPNITATIEVLDNTTTMPDGKSGAYRYCLENNYITGPTAATSTGITINNETVLTPKTGKDNEFTGQFSVQSKLFGWGSHFADGEKNVNPYIFYNKHAHEDKITGSDATTYYDDAMTVRNGAIAKLDGVKFKITINAQHA